MRSKSKNYSSLVFFFVLVVEQSHFNDILFIVYHRWESGLRPWQDTMWIEKKKKTIVSIDVYSAIKNKSMDMAEFYGLLTILVILSFGDDWRQLG